MKCSIKKDVIAIVMLLSAVSLGGTYSGGDGSAGNPYKISSVADWQELMGTSTDWGKQFLLISNLDLMGVTVLPVGNNISGQFLGVFDGNGYTISNAVINQPGSYYIGLFGNVGADGQIRNLGIDNINVTGSSYVGGLVGANGGNIEFCYMTGTVSGSSVIGGLVGSNSYGTIKFSYTIGTVSGNSTVGGLAGSNDGGKLSCDYARGAVNGTSYVGGLVGIDSGIIEYCYASGTVGGSSLVGGLVGWNTGIPITSCFWDTQTSGIGVGVGSGPSTGVTGETTGQMQMLSTFTDAAWDFAGENANGVHDFWEIPSNDYPRINSHLAELTFSGEGTTANPYIILNANDLAKIWLKPSAHYRLDSDVDLSGIYWSGIIVPSFSGIFDGNGHVISNLITIALSTEESIGLFGYLGPGGQIHDLDTENVNLTGSGYIGGIVGHNYGGRLRSCYATGSINGTGCCGGLVGKNEGTIIFSEATATIVGQSYVGGVAGYNAGGAITSCYASGSVSGSSYVGGLAGRSNGYITTCHATGEVNGDSYVGGLVGENSSTIAYSYATGAVSGTSVAGGFVGMNGEYGAITSCFWDTQTSGLDVGVGSGSATGVTGKSTLLMQTQSTFTDAGWDFSDTDGDFADWQISSSNYPQLVTLHYSGGSGIEADPYKIATKADLLALAININDYSKCFILTANIDLAGETFTNCPLAPSTSSGFEFQGTPFTGIFDGNGHLICNLTITAPTVDFVGLFGSVVGEIKNLGIENATITGDMFVGGIMGYNDHGSITSCYVTGSVVGIYAVGGIAGENDGGVISSCYATCDVSGNTGSGLSAVGGLVGLGYGTTEYCYASGAVTGNESGGIVGEGSYNASNMVVTYCFWDIQASGQEGSARGGRGLSTQQMKTMSIFVNAGWAGHDWVIEDGLDYPRLAWQNTGGIPIPTAGAIPLSGSGTKSDPYQIISAAEFASLSWYAGILDKYLVLTTDIDMAGITAYPIGSLDIFSGGFDGAGHVVRNLVINQPGMDHVGMFGIIMSWDNQICNLSIEDATITGRDSVGGLAGVSAGIISGCDVAGSVIGRKHVGGLAGWGSSNCNISRSYFTGEVSGNVFVGGLVGDNYSQDSVITSCYATGVITGAEGAGGLVGENWGIVNNCYSKSSVTCTDPYGNYFGGLVGLNEREGKISYCYSTGEVWGCNCTGGLVGLNDYWNIYHGIINSCFWDTQSSGSSTGLGCGSSSGTSYYGKTTSEMQAQSTFTNEGWDFSGTDGDAADWIISGIEYPRLIWEITVVVPNVVGQNQADAEIALTGMGLWSTITYDFSNTIPAGQVISQSPTAGQSVSGGTQIHLVISLGTHYSGGSGMKANPYQISTIRDWQILVNYSSDWDKYFILTTDIDLSGVTVTPVGNSNVQFTGVFDGNGYAISNVVINHPDSNYVGLFGVGSGGEIHNLGVENLDLTGFNYVGGLAGYYYGTITNCYVTGSVKGIYAIGGLVGYNYGTITGCHASSSVDGVYDTGGLVGYNYGSIISCYATGEVSGTDSYVGGLSGENGGSISSCYATGSVGGTGYYIGGLSGVNYGPITSSYASGSVSGTYYLGGLVGEDDGGTLTHCYATGSVIGTDYIGGLIGYTYGTISSCYASGFVSGDNFVGGLVGVDEGVLLTDCFWDIETSGQTSSAVGEGKTTAEMQAISTFIAVGWDFTNEIANGTNDYWRMCVDDIDYPMLNWESIEGDFACPDGVSTEDFDYYVELWLMNNCSSDNNYCGGTDMNLSGIIDLADFAIFAQHWMEGVSL